MSTLEFIASLVKSLAWPLTATVALLVFRARISSWLQERPKRLKAGPLELEWERTLAQVEVELDDVDVTSHGQNSPRSGGVSGDLTILAQSHPEAAVLDAYRRMEVLLNEALERSGIEPPRRGAAGLARLAREKEIISPETQRAVDGISVLRNLTAHGRTEVSPDQALDYVNLVDAVVYAITENSAGATYDGPGGSDPR